MLFTKNKPTRLVWVLVFSIIAGFCFCYSVNAQTVSHVDVSHADWIFAQTSFPRPDVQSVVKGVLASGIKVVLLHAPVWDWSRDWYGDGSQDATKKYAIDLVQSLRQAGIVVGFHCNAPHIANNPDADNQWLQNVTPILTQLQAKIVYADGAEFFARDYAAVPAEPYSANKSRGYLQAIRKIIGSDGFMMSSDYWNAMDLVNGVGTMDQWDDSSNQLVPAREYVDYAVYRLQQCVKGESLDPAKVPQVFQGKPQSASIGNNIPLSMRFEIGWIGDARYDGNWSSPINAWPESDYEYVWNKSKASGFPLTYYTTLEFLARSSNQSLLQKIGAIEQPVYSITATSDNNGVITPNGTVTINSNASRTFVITPNSGYKIANVIVDNVSVGIPSSYKFDNVSADHTISVSFTAIPVSNYSLVVLAQNGTVSKNPDSSSYISGTQVSLTATPSAGYIFTSWSGDIIGSSNPITVIMNSNKSITANFSVTNPNTYTITPIQGLNGLIFPSEMAIVNSGSSKTYSITPNPGYQILNVLVDDVSQGAISAYTFNDVLANHTISASFSSINNQENQDTSKLLSQIAQLKAQIAQLTNNISIPDNFVFNNNLVLGQNSDDVRYLQIFLNSDLDTKIADSGWGSPGHESIHFGKVTYNAVVKFQEKYSADIFSNSAQIGKGKVGPKTRAKINALLKSLKSGKII